MNRFISDLDKANVQEQFKLTGRQNLLQHYRGQFRQNTTALNATFHFLVLCSLWFAFIVTLSAGAGMSFNYFAPLFFDYTLIPLSESLNISTDWVVTLNKLISGSTPIVSTLAFIPFNAMFCVLLERKLLSVLTCRLGPNRAGYNGLFQTFFDGLKLLFKEDVSPSKTDKFLFMLAPALFFAPSILVFLPLVSVASGSHIAFAGGAFAENLIFIFAMASISIVAVLIAGYASYNKYSLMGGLRSVAQALCYEIPMILTVIAFVLIIGTLNLNTINFMQADSILAWNIFGGGILTSDFSQYLAYFQSGDIKQILFGIVSVFFAIVQLLLFPLLALILYTTFLAETNRTPFDLPEAESELVSGFNTEYSGMKFALFFLAEYTNLTAVCALFSILFLGGTSLGLPFIEKPLVNLLGGMSWVLGLIIVLFKTYLMISLAIWIRATLPRFKPDQLMPFAWKYIIPLNLVILLIAALCKVFVL